LYIFLYLLCMHFIYFIFLQIILYISHIEYEVRDIGDRIAFITICCQSKQTLDV